MLKAQILSRGISRAKEFANAIKYFFALQCFFALIMISFSLKGGTALGFIMAVPAVFAFFSGAKKGSVFLFLYTGACFVIGQRTIYIGQFVRFVPSDILMIGLACMTLISRPRYPIPPGQSVPIFVWTLFFFSSAAIFFRSEWYPLNAAISLAKMMWMAIPAYLLVRYVGQRIQDYQSFFTIIIFGNLFLSTLALGEYYNFGFIHYFSGFLDTQTSTGYEGFRRLGGRFWGGPMLAGYLSIFFPMTLTQINLARTFTQKALFLLSLVLTLLSIYFSGHRGIWIAVAMGVACFYYLRGLKGIFVLIIIITIGYVAMPEHAKTRFETLFGSKKDSSAVKRLHRAQDAWELIKKDPIIGHGWGASGLVHSDILQIWADTGFGGFASLLLLFLLNVKRLHRFLYKTRNKIYKEYVYGLIASIVCCYIILGNQAWFNLPEQYAPFWMLMALAYFFPATAAIETKIQTQTAAETGPMIPPKAEGASHA